MDYMDINDNKEQIQPFLDAEGRIHSWPAKRNKQLLILTYLSQFFHRDQDYREKEVNEIISHWHTFGDFFLLRRELIASGLLLREKDGSRYWKQS